MLAMPLFHGWEHVEQTLESIRKQTYSNYRLLISVDGGDRRSHDACLRFTDDPRVKLVLQETRLGWAGNINWLAGQLREDYFCYWQHDDQCHPDYLKILLKHALRHPEAAAVYCDMQRFGKLHDIERHESVTGFALQRVLAQARRANPVPIRCLIRSDAMRFALPVSPASVWTIALARVGELHRVPKTLYFRRMREDSLGVQMLSRPESETLAATLEFSLGILKYAHPLVQTDEHGRLMAMILHQVTRLQTRGRYQFDFSSADPDMRGHFVTDFLDTAIEDFRVDRRAAEEARVWLDKEDGFPEDNRLGKGEKARQKISTGLTEPGRGILASLKNLCSKKRD